MKLCIIDIAILACFIPAIWVGLKKGLVHQLISIAAAVISIWLGFHFCGDAAAWAAEKSEADPVVLKALSFFIIFITSAVLLHIVGWLLEKALKIAKLGWLNRLSGLLFAVLEYALIICIVIILFDKANSVLHLVDGKTLEPAFIYNFFKDTAYDLYQWTKSFS